jgi:hypothetical protein
LIGIGCSQDVVADIFATLLQEKALLSGDDQQLLQLFQRPSRDALSCNNLLVCMTGAVQTASFNPFLSVLRFAFCRELKIILTKSARKFVQEKTLVQMLGVDVFSDTFQGTSTDFGVPHISLSEWASCILVAPATAASIHRIAHATCDDLLSLTVTAASPDVPVVIGPSMNTHMWHNPALQENLSLCRKRGYWIIEPGLGDEVNTDWEKRTARVGVFGAEPGGLVRVMVAIYAIHKSRKLSA